MSFNKINTFQWYNKRVYKLDNSYDASDRLMAMEKSMEWGERIPIGILYKEDKHTYSDRIEFLNGEQVLVEKIVNMKKIRDYMKDFI